MNEEKLKQAIKEQMLLDITDIYLRYLRGDTDEEIAEKFSIRLLDRIRNEVQA